MIDSDGTFRYLVPTDARGLVQLGIWLKARVLPMLCSVFALAVVLIGLALWLDSLVLLVLGIFLLIEYPFLLVVCFRRMRRGYEERFGATWAAAFGPGGVRVDASQVSTTFVWDYFVAWTVRRGQLIVVHSGLTPLFVAVPIAVVPEDEWQSLTTLMYERLGPARTPESLRGSRSKLPPVRKPDESAALHH